MKMMCVCRILHPQEVQIVKYNETVCVCYVSAANNNHVRQIFSYCDEWLFWMVLIGRKVSHCILGMAFHANYSNPFAIHNN